MDNLREENARILAPQVSKLSGTSSYPLDVKPVIKQGSVADRISQLQAKLSTEKFTRPVSPTITRGPGTPKALSRYSMSMLMLSPGSIPLPETPTLTGDDPSRPQIDSVTYTGLKRIEKGHTVPTNSGFRRETDSLDVVKANEDTLEHERCNRIDNGRSFEDKEIQPLFQDRQAPIAYPELQDTSFKLPDLRTTEIPSKEIRIVESPLRRSSRALRPSGEDKNAKAMDTRYNTGSRRRSLTPGGAYSKIMPFVLSPTTPSYVPRRASQVFDAPEDISPARLRKISLQDPDTTSASPERSQSGSPRKRNERSLRRRTFITRSEDTARGIVEETSHPAESNGLEDVFTKPAQKPKAYRVESVIMAETDVAGPSRTSQQVQNNQNPHDIHNPAYVPSIMPLAIHSRHVSKARRARSTSALAAKKQSSVRVASNEAPDEQSSSRETDRGWNNLSNDEKTNFYLYNAHTNNTSTHFPWTRRDESGAEMRAVADQRTFRRSLRMESPRVDQAILTTDGAYDGSVSDQSTESERETINIAFIADSEMGSSVASGQGSSAVSVAGSTSSSSVRVSSNIPVESIQRHRQHGLKVIITMNQDIKDVVKIELHPPMKHVDKLT